MRIKMTEATNNDVLTVLKMVPKSNLTIKSCIYSELSNVWSAICNNQTGNIQEITKKALDNVEGNQSIIIMDLLKETFIVLNNKYWINSLISQLDDHVSRLTILFCCLIEYITNSNINTDIIEDEEVKFDIRDLELFKGLIKDIKGKDLI